MEDKTLLAFRVETVEKHNKKQLDKLIKNGNKNIEF